MTGAQHFAEAQRLLAAGDEDDTLRALVHTNLASVAVAVEQERNADHDTASISARLARRDAWDAVFAAHPEPAKV